MTLINVERSPNLELYTFVCNTFNLHDTEVERSRTAFYIDQLHED
jgi:hypothetical protein